MNTCTFFFPNFDLLFTPSEGIIYPLGVDLPHSENPCSRLIEYCSLQTSSSHFFAYARSGIGSHFGTSAEGALCVAISTSFSESEQFMGTVDRTKEYAAS